MYQSWTSTRLDDRISTMKSPWILGGCHDANERNSRRFYSRIQFTGRLLVLWMVDSSKNIFKYWGASFARNHHRETRRWHMQSSPSSVYLVRNLPWSPDIYISPFPHFVLQIDQYKYIHFLHPSLHHDWSNGSVELSLREVRILLVGYLVTILSRL